MDLKIQPNNFCCFLPKCASIFARNVDGCLHPDCWHGRSFSSFARKNVVRLFDCFIQGYHSKLTLSDNIYEKTEYFFSKKQTNTTNTKPARSTSIFICCSDAKTRKQPVTEPSISWTHHVFIIITKNVD